MGQEVLRFLHGRSLLPCLLGGFAVYLNCTVLELCCHFARWWLLQDLDSQLNAERRVFVKEGKESGRGEIAIDIAFLMDCT